MIAFGFIFYHEAGHAIMLHSSLVSASRCPSHAYAHAAVCTLACAFFGLPPRFLFEFFAYATTFNVCLGEFRISSMTYLDSEGQEALLAPSTAPACQPGWPKPDGSNAVVKRRSVNFSIKEHVVAVS
jgi:hypothetical protein